MATESASESGGAGAAAELTLLDKIVQEGKMAVEPSQNAYSKLLGDYYFGRDPQDMALLQRLSKVAAAAHAPFVAAAAPSLFDMGSFTELGVPRDLSKIFESAELTTWRGFRDSEDSRYVTL